jgi:hypothetical protein
MDDLRDLLAIGNDRLDEINRFLIDPENKIIESLLAVVDRYGGPNEINRKAREAGKLENLMARLRENQSPYLADLEWLIEQRDRNAFTSMEAYYDRVLGERAKTAVINQKNAVTLEISALQYFPWSLSC